jgi:hypothetical protein
MTKSDDNFHKNFNAFAARLDADRKEKQHRFNLALAEARRMLCSYEAEGMYAMDFRAEINYRSKTNAGSDVTNFLEDYAEIESIMRSNGIVAILKQIPPDERFLSEYTPNVIPIVENGWENYPDVSHSHLDKRRALLTQRVIQKHIKEGSTILVRKPNGDIEEVPFLNIEEQI